MRNNNVAGAQQALLGTGLGLPPVLKNFQNESPVLTGLKDFFFQLLHVECRFKLFKKIIFPTAGK